MNASDPGLSKTWKHQSCQKIVGSSFFLEKCNIIKPNYILKKNLLESQNSRGFEKASSTFLSSSI